MSQLESTIQLKEAFSAWSHSYDQQPNPLLALEERYLLRLLPKIEGRDVVDAGCGTGRWLAQLGRLKPHSLHGIDFSEEMLTMAAARRVPHARLSLAPCDELPVENVSIDVLLASFVLSYVDDLGRAAKEFARVLRPGGDLLLSDMHPETAARLNWKRSFLSGEVEVELPVHRRSIREIIEAFNTEGFVERTVIELPFGAEERSIFSAHGKLERFAEAEHLPAIYVLHLTKRSESRSCTLERRLLFGAQCALGPGERVAASVVINSEMIETVSSRPSRASSDAVKGIDLSGYLFFPGFVNAHDHLDFALFPRLGRGPYQNAAEWAQDIQKHDAEIIALHRRVSKQTRLWWGGIRNLLSGVTTVCHHNPIDPCLLADDFPVRVVARFGWEHSLPFGIDVKAAYNSTPEDQPFIIHACEGTDEHSRDEILKLDELGVLGPRTVLVHGLALGEQEAALLNARGASLVACPSSNSFLFGRAPSQEILNSVARLALGSDSPLTAVGNLLDEIRFAAETCALSPQKLYSLVTDSPNSILCQGFGGGPIRPGRAADLIAVRDRRGEPAETLCLLSANDIELVLLAGRVQLASEAIYERLPQQDREGLEPLSVGGTLRWLRAPIEALLGEAEDVLGAGQVRLGGRLLCRP